MATHLTPDVLDEWERHILTCFPLPWPSHVVSGDAIHYDVPGSKQHVNTGAVWSTGPLARSRLRAMADAKLIEEAPSLILYLIRDIRLLRDRVASLGGEVP